MSAEDKLHARIKAFLDKNYPCCDVAGCCGEEEEAWAILDIVKAAGFGLVADAKAEALTEAAERFKQRSDTYHKTMQEMTASKEYGLEDIVRYGAYSAESNTTATWLRTQASVIRNQS